MRALGRIAWIGLLACCWAPFSVTAGDVLRSGSADAEGVEGLPVAPGYRASKHFQSKRNAPLGVIDTPSGLHVSSEGWVFVTDRELHRVQRFDLEGLPINEYGIRGGEPGELTFPTGVAYDPATRRVYIGDTGNQRIAVFDLNGAFIENLEGFGTPTDLAVGADGRLFVRDGNLVRILVPDEDDPDPIQAVHVDPRRNEIARGMTVDNKGRPYVLVSGNLFRYAADGTGGVFQRDTNRLFGRAVSFDAAGRIYFLTERRLFFHRAGSLFLPIPVEREVLTIGGGEEGSVFFLMEKSRDRRAGISQRHFEQGRMVGQRRWGLPQTVTGWLKQPLRIASDAAGIYVVDDLKRIQRFDHELQGASGQVEMPGLLDVERASAGELLVARMRYGAAVEDDEPSDPDVPPAGMQRSIVERIRPARSLWDGGESEAPEVLWSHAETDRVLDPSGTRIMGLAYNEARDRHWVLDGGRERLRAFAADGSLEHDIELEHFDVGYPRWSDIAVDASGVVLALHSAARYLDRFDADGRPSGRMILPAQTWRIDVDDEDQLVLSTARRWNWRLDDHGHPLALWRLPPPAFGFEHPISDLTASGDEVFSLDQSNSSILGFEASSGAGVPAAGNQPESRDPSCRFVHSLDATPREVELGEAVDITLQILGNCAPHRRGGHRPDVLALDATVSITLPEGVEPVEGSMRPPAVVSGRGLRWELLDLRETGVEIRFSIHSTRPGRWIIPEIGRLETLDGWYNLSTAALEETVFFTLIPPTATPEAKPNDSPVLYLPRLSLRHP